MALIVEDGTNVTNANSFVTVAWARSYAESRALTLPDDDDALIALLIRATDYLEGKRAFYKGEKTYETQSLQWPRIDVDIDGISQLSTAIPRELKAAQVQLAVEMQAGVDLMPTLSTPFIKREVVGLIETEYSESVGVRQTPKLSAIDALLAPLLRKSGMLSTTRV